MSIQSTPGKSSGKTLKIQINLQGQKIGCTFFFQRVKIPYTLGSHPEVLASRKVVWGDPCTEGSGTAKACTDEQECLRGNKQYSQTGA